MLLAPSDAQVIEFTLASIKEQLPLTYKLQCSSFGFYFQFSWLIWINSYHSPCPSLFPSLPLPLHLSHIFVCIWKTSFSLSSICFTGTKGPNLSKQAFSKESHMHKTPSVPHKVVITYSMKYACITKYHIRLLCVSGKIPSYYLSWTILEMLTT